MMTRCGAFLFSFPSLSISSFYQYERCETRSDVIGLMDSREKEKLFVLLLGRTRDALGRTLSKNKTDLI